MLSHILKQETRCYHEALEAQVDIPACLASPQAWLWLLETFYGYCSPMETALFSSPCFCEWVPDSHLRRKAEFLSSDIEALGGDTPHVPLCPDLPRLTSVAERFGSLYVMEGATLGGQIISRMAAERGYTPGRGCAYFSSYGDDVGAMWKAFGQHLERYRAAHPETQDAIIASSIETFVKFRAWVSRRKRELSTSNDYVAER